MCAVSPNPCLQDHIKYVPAAPVGPYAAHLQTIPEAAQAPPPKKQSKPGKLQEWISSCKSQSTISSKVSEMLALSRELMGEQLRDSKEADLAKANERWESDAHQLEKIRADGAFNRENAKVVEKRDSKMAASLAEQRQWLQHSASATATSQAGVSLQVCSMAADIAEMKQSAVQSSRSHDVAFTEIRGLLLSLKISGAGHASAQAAQAAANLQSFKNAILDGNVATAQHINRLVTNATNLLCSATIEGIALVGDAVTGTRPTGFTALHGTMLERVHHRLEAAVLAASDAAAARAAAVGAADEATATATHAAAEVEDAVRREAAADAELEAAANQAAAAATEALETIASVRAAEEARAAAAAPAVATVLATPSNTAALRASMARTSTVPPAAAAQPHLAPPLAPCLPLSSTRSQRATIAGSTLLPKGFSAGGASGRVGSGSPTALQTLDAVLSPGSRSGPAQLKSVPSARIPFDHGAFSDLSAEAIAQMLSHSGQQLMWQPQDVLVINSISSPGNLTVSGDFSQLRKPVCSKRQVPMLF